jgi:leucyl aminopeptidase
MEIRIKVGELSKVKTDVLIAEVFEAVKTLPKELEEIDKTLNGVISKMLESDEIKGGKGEITPIYTLGKLPFKKLVIYGLGKRQDLTKDSLRNTIGDVARYLNKKGIKTFTTSIPGAGAIDINAADAAQSISEGALLGTYDFKKYRSVKDKNEKIKGMVIMAPNKVEQAIVENGCNKGRIIAEAIAAARDMVNEPPSFMNPTELSAEAAKIAKNNDIELEVLEQDKLKEMGMGAMLAVGRGSNQTPKLIVLSYEGDKTKDIDLALVGKGITFDSGGLSLKPSAHMDEMKMDMAGGAAVIAVMGAIAKFKPGINVTAIVPAVENMPSGSAYKPGDIITTMSGKTVEVRNTDAEGRLILADALDYAVKLGAKNIIDVATLTGACVVALGSFNTGGFTNNQNLMDKVITAGNMAGESIWQLPATEEYRELIKSSIADIQNVGTVSRAAGSTVGAMFLKEFVGDTPWVHLDIAGTAWADKEGGIQAKGGTGVPVGTLIRLALEMIKKSSA